MGNVVFDEILGKVRAGDVNSGGGGGGGSDLIAGNGLTIAGGTASVAPGYRMNTSGGTVNQDRFFPIETVSGTSVTLQAGHAYIINATTSAGITLNCESFAANTFGLEGHATIYTANAGYVQQGANVYLADPLEPDAVNNCTIRFHGGSATVSVEDYFGGYIVLSGGTGSGSLPYGLASAGSQYIGFNASLNGQTLDLAGAVANGEKHIVGNGYTSTTLTGAVNCGTSKFTVANLALSNVQVTGGVMTLGDAYIPSGSTVAVSGGGLAVEKVTGAGETSVIDLGEMHIEPTPGVTSASGVTVTGGSAGIGGAFSLPFVGRTVLLTSCTLSGNKATNHGGAIDIQSGNSAVISRCTVSNNSAYNGGGLSIRVGAHVYLYDSVVSGNIGTNGADINIPSGTLDLTGSNVIGLLTGASGTVTLTSGAILDLTGNENPTPIAPGGGVTFEPGSATILTGGTAGVVDAQYALGGMTVPNLGNMNVIPLSGAHVAVSSGTATASNAIFSGGSGTNGGGIAVVNGAIVTLTDCTVAGCTAQSYGKGMYLSRGTATLSNCTLETNGDASQPEIVVRASSTLTVSGGSIRRIDLYDGTASIAGTVTLGAVSATANTDGGPLTISSGAILDLTGNSNATPIAPGGGITFEAGGAKVKWGSGTNVSSAVVEGTPFDSISNDGVFSIATESANAWGNSLTSITGGTVKTSGFIRPGVTTNPVHIFSDCTIDTNRMYYQTEYGYCTYILGGIVDLRCFISALGTAIMRSGSILIEENATIDVTSTNHASAFFISAPNGLVVAGGDPAKSFTVKNGANEYTIKGGTYTVLNKDGSTVPPQA